MMSPLENVLGNLPLLGQAGVCLANIESLGLSLKADAGDEAVNVAQAGSCRRIELRQVVHQYRGDGDEQGFSVGPIDLTLHGGESVFFIGGNGSGKTTLAKLVAGLYAPTAGELLLDGQPMREATQDQYRQHVSAVFTDCHLFEHLIDAASEERMALAHHYMARFHLDHKVKIRAGKFSTLDLSQGQRKRLALLAAYMEDRPVYLFDEWAADQDPAFKEVFYTRLLPELRSRGKIVIVITHDEHYFHTADRIVKLDNGQITADAPRNLQTASS